MWMNDLRLAVRVLAKRPGFTGVIVTTLALGIGVTTALFGVFRGVFLKPLPLPEPEELVVVMETAGFGCCGPASGPDYVDWAGRERSFDGMAMLSPMNVTLTGLDEPERFYATMVTPSAFDLLGVDAAQGRVLRDEDQIATDVVVLSYETWRRVFEGRSDALGETMEIDGTPRTIVGVMPEDFDVRDRLRLRRSAGAVRVAQRPRVRRAGGGGMRRSRPARSAFVTTSSWDRSPSDSSW